MTLLRIAHRGASSQAPENTMAAFERAIELGADMLEMDVRVCRSGEAIIMHDAAVDRTTNGTGEVSALELDGIRALDAGEGERIPLFSEVVDRCAPRCGLLIELKEMAAADPVVSILSDRELQMRGDIVVQAFDAAALVRCAQLAPDITRHLLLGSEPVDDWLKVAGRCHAASVNPHQDLVTPEFIQLCRDHGHGVIPWTVDEPEDIERMKGLGVDGIISNYPERI